MSKKSKLQIKIEGEIKRLETELTIAINDRVDASTAYNNIKIKVETLRELLEN